MAALSRRGFLKLSALAALLPARLDAAGRGLRPGGAFPDDTRPPGLRGRVTASRIYAHTQPSLSSPRQQRFERDALLDLDEALVSPFGPAANPRWYRVGPGFVHSAHLQRVELAQLNPTLQQAPETGLLGQITVPVSPSLRRTPQGGWEPFYRLYYASNHWITGVFPGPDGRPWYTLTDDWLKVEYCAPGEHLRLVRPAELLPAAPGLDPEQKRIVVSLGRQTLQAWAGDRLVLSAPISSGQRFKETPTGEFRIQRKLPSRHMGDGALTADPNANEYPGVPWVCFFTSGGVALHGAYWHDNFGAPTSSGCVNLRPADALWLFRWSDPYYEPQVSSRAGWRVRGEGTRVSVVP